LNKDGEAIAVNTFGAHGLVSRTESLTSTFYTFDLQGSVAQRLDYAGNVLSSHLFTAHGNEVTTPSTDPFGSGAQWGYYSDRETGLQLLTNRYYDPQAGRFLTRDPISYDGGINLYAYVNNQPVNFADPLGLYPPSHPFCQALRRKIENIERDIAKRIGERHEDKLELPWRAPGDETKPSLSRWGHEKIINILKANKAALEAEYAVKCSDSEPKSCNRPNPQEETAEERRLQEKAEYHMRWVYGSAGAGAIAIGFVVGAPAAVLGGILWAF
jgi:RHS repeat-associated protein